MSQSLCHRIAARWVAYEVGDARGAGDDGGKGGDISLQLKKGMINSNLRTRGDGCDDWVLQFPREKTTF